MNKSPDAFRTISEVADWLGVQAHVLRFWESKFVQVKPVKRAGGRRYYRPNDMRLLGGIKRLLHDDGMTIKGVQKILRKQGITYVSAYSQALEDGLEIVANAPISEPEAPVENEGVENEGTVVPLSHAPRAPETAPDMPAGMPVDDESEPGAAPQPPSLTPEQVGLDFDETGAQPHGEQEPESEPARQEEIAAPVFARSSTRTSAAETPAAPRPRVIEAPDPPPESELPYQEGALARLTNLSTLGPASARQLAPLVREMRDWLTRMGRSDAT